MRKLSGPERFVIFEAVKETPFERRLPHYISLWGLGFIFLLVIGVLCAGAASVWSVRADLPPLMLTVHLVVYGGGLVFITPLMAAGIYLVWRSIPRP